MSKRYKTEHRNSIFFTGSPDTHEVLEDQRNEEQWMDTREAETAIRNDKAMETVEK